MLNLRHAIPTLVITALAACPAHALDGYLKVTGSQQGAINGDSTANPFVNNISVNSYGYEVKIPTDGPDANRKAHQPLVIHKSIDRSSAGLMKAMVDQERLSEFKLTFVRLGNGGGTLQPCLTITITGGAVVGIKQQIDASSGSSGTEDVSFSFDQIKWDYTIINPRNPGAPPTVTSVTDSWSGTGQPANTRPRRRPGMPPTQ